MDYTILVNSCDRYEDLWYPFFKLLKKYWVGELPKIVLNTETKSFSMEDMTILCPHCNDNPHGFYGKRLKYALSRIDTEYVLCLLDDFFVRKPIDTQEFRKLIGYMNDNRNICCFNFDNSFQGEASECYEGFIVRPRVADYKLNMQAALWRKADLESFWKDKVDPWMWETVSNKVTFWSNKEFYYLAGDAVAPIYYGKKDGLTWGVVRGKWFAEDIIPLFEKEEIQMDFSVRGFYQSAKESKKKSMNWYRYFCNEIYILGLGYAVKDFVYSTVVRRVSLLLGKDVGNYEAYLKRKYNG